MACIRGQCPWWFDSFWIWYDIWSAIIAASIQMHIRGSKNLNRETKDLLFTFYEKSTNNVLGHNEQSSDSRWIIIRKALLLFNPFPRCLTEGCDCFGRLLCHEYQDNTWVPGVSGDAVLEMKHVQAQISSNLGRRQDLLQDADGHIAQLSNRMLDHVKQWTAFPAAQNLEIGQSDTYIVNCQNLHPLNGLTLRRIFDDANESTLVDIVLAAGSCAKYAVISKEQTAYKLTILSRDLGVEQELWSVNLQAQPFSLAISRQGDKVAVGYALGTQVFDVTTGHSELLPSALPKDHWDPSHVDSQCLSFSSDSSCLAVATREAKSGLVFTGLHTLSPSSRQNHRMQHFSIPLRYPCDFRLSSIIFDKYTGKILVCSSTSKGHITIIDSSTKAVEPMTSRDFNPFPGDQIQCAIAVPGPSTRIALVNDKNKVFMLKSEDSRWMFKPIRCKLDESRLEVKKIDDKLSMAGAESGTLRMFWMKGTEGRLLSIDITEASSSKVETIPTPF
ncbi:MAG: hypothetical protein Q9191_002249 [Dirinaria sp. TL-2023a]